MDSKRYKPGNTATQRAPQTAIALSHSFPETIADAVDADQHPCPDFLALSRALNADLIAFDQVGNRAAALAKVTGFARAAWNGFTARGSYDLVISDLERPGLLLALLLRLSRTKRSHVMICHGKIAQMPDKWALRRLGLHRGIDRFVCYGREVADRLEAAVPELSRRITTVYHAADHHFWRPLDVRPERTVVSAGMLRRDYPTLIQALGNEAVDVELAAYSPWVTGDGLTAKPGGLPANVHLHRCNYSELRDLYARSLAIAVPLTENFSQSGSLVVYEAMAMGKPVLVTRTQGQAKMGLIRHGETGFYLEPGDVEGWRSAVRYLLDHPDEAEKMGEAARAEVEGGMNQDSYVAAMCKVVEETLADR